MSGADVWEVYGLEPAGGRVAPAATWIAKPREKRPIRGKARGFGDTATGASSPADVSMVAGNEAHGSTGAWRPPAARHLGVAAHLPRDGHAVAPAASWHFRHFRHCLPILLNPFDRRFRYYLHG